MKSATPQEKLNIFYDISTRSPKSDRYSWKSTVYTVDVETLQQFSGK
ncbi:MAG: hypothetical protein RMY29_011115 [Nostoc sp. CreGUA01]|nr:hypothetical protein [Nostoc sp. CreGUA01]